MSFLETIRDPRTVITPIDSTIRFPEVLTALLEKYEADIDLFCDLVQKCDDSSDLLRKIRSTRFSAAQRMSLLKIFRRCVAPVLDTETTKKITISSDSLIENFGSTFKPIEKLREQFGNITAEVKSTLAALIGEYDTRGQQGYRLTELFFDWFEHKFRGLMSIAGPRRAGPDIELSAVFPEFTGSYPCDFVIRPEGSSRALAVGFARYDSTRGGAQSDDRTGGNSFKVAKAQEFTLQTGKTFRLIFVADGPGLGHRDTWQEACQLDGMNNDNVRVTTLKLADQRITKGWLMSIK